MHLPMATVVTTTLVAALGGVPGALACAGSSFVHQSGSGVSPRLDQRVAPSLAMSTDAAEERDSQPAQRDELAHSHIVPTRGGVLPPANDPSPTAITENTGSQ